MEGKDKKNFILVFNFMCRASIFYGYIIGRKIQQMVEY